MVTAVIGDFTLIAVASLLAEHGLSGVQAQLLQHLCLVALGVVRSSRTMD